MAHPTKVSVWWLHVSAMQQYGILISHPGCTASGAPGHSRNTNIGRTGSGRMEGSDKQSWEQSAEEADRSCRGGRWRKDGPATVKVVSVQRGWCWEGSQCWRDSWHRLVSSDKTVGMMSKWRHQGQNRAHDDYNAAFEMGIIKLFDQLCSVNLFSLVTVLSTKGTCCGCGVAVWFFCCGQSR